VLALRSSVAWIFWPIIPAALPLKLSQFLLFIRFDLICIESGICLMQLELASLPKKSIHDLSLHGHAALDAHVHACRNINAIGVRLMQLHAQRSMHMCVAAIADEVLDAMWMIFGHMRSGLLFS
jgi:hypothetical protein